MRFYLTSLLLLVTILTNGQFSDDFGDGDFTSAPIWSGSSANFIVNPEGRLQLSAPAEASASYLSLSSTEMDNVTWDFWLNMDFNPSSANYARVYLVSNQSDLTGDLDGYFIQVGGVDDEVSLYRQNGATTAKILDGTDDVVDVSDVFIRVRVTRDGSGNWEIFHDATGGFSFTSEGTVLDATYTTTDYFGVLCNYTATRSDKFFFDELGVPYVDGVAPELESAAAVSATEVDVNFSEPLESLTAELVVNYLIDNGIGNPITATIDGTDPSLVHLVLGSEMTNGSSYQLTVENVEDLDGNPVAVPSETNFTYFIPEEAEENDVIFTELLPDPNPVIGLPEVEFFEIYNRSDKTFDLLNWTVNDNSNTATFPTYILGPNEYVVICAPGDGTLFSVPNVLEVDGLPTLTNAEDELVLKDQTTREIDSINYNLSWYNDSDKENGGWTMERKHLNAPCSDGNNWGASININGGTPGLQNSIWTDIDDTNAPKIVGLEIESELLIRLTFNEFLDTTQTLTFSITPTIDALEGSYSSLNTVDLLTETLEASVIYTLEIGGGTDCWGNEIDQKIEFGLPEIAEVEDIILNEVLFNPLTGGSDYVEVYNKSNKVIDLNQLYLANYDEEDGISNYKQIGEEQFLLLPDNYALLTEDSTDIINDFAIYGIGRFIETDLPTYPNDSGTVYLTLSDSTLVDFFSYDEDFHYALIKSEDGKALERITFGGGMNNPENWHTASENVDWGTPGYKNSQFLVPNTVGDVSIDPQLFSPDNDGYNDILTINFRLNETDNIADVRIYDNQGRIIRKLQDNYFIGQEGFLTWDGINDDGEKAAIGTYIVFVSVKNVAGDESLFKLVAVLGGQL